MRDNPYQAPTTQTNLRTGESIGRVQAITHFRLIFLILFVPAVYNYWCFDDAVIVGSGIRFPTSALYRAVNISLMLAGGLLAWQFGVPAIEWLSRNIRNRFAIHADDNVWMKVLYDSIRRALYLSIPGAILWAIWVFAFYHLHVDFYIISYAVGIPAHILGACFYVPLFVQWYRLARGASVVK